MATTINTLGVGMYLDTRNYVNGSKLARSETNKLVRELEKVRTPAEAYGRQIGLLDKALDAGAISQELHQRAVAAANAKFGEAAQQIHNAAGGYRAYKNEVSGLSRLLKQGVIDQATFNSLVASAEQQAKKTAAAIDKLDREIREYAEAENRAAAASRQRMQSWKGVQQERQTSQLGATVLMLGRFTGVGLTAAGAIRGVGSSLREFGQAEVAAKDFGVLTGSMEQGTAMFRELRELAKTSPLNLQGVSKGARTLLSFGAEAEKVVGLLKMLGEVSGGNAQRFESLALVMGQVNAAQRLTGQDLLQFVNAGWNPLLQISQDTGVSMSELRKRMEEGAISFAMVEQALRRATGAGGMFEGRMAEMSNTLDGKITILKSSFGELLTSVGQFFAPFGKMLVDALSGVVSFVSYVVDSINQLGMAVGLIDEIGGKTETVAQNIERAAAASENAADAFTTLTEQNQKFSGPSVQETDTQSAEAEFQRLRDRNMELTMSKDLLFEYKLSLMSISDEMKDQLRQERERNEILEQRAKDAEKLKRDEEKFQQDIKRAAEDLDRRKMAAHKAAMQYFDEERRKQMKLRSDIAKGPGSGMEVGSAEANRFLAQQENARIAQEIAPERDVTSEMVNKKAEEIFKKEQAAEERRLQRVEAIGRQLEKAVRESSTKRAR